MSENTSSLWQVFRSVAAGAFGVQSEKNRQQDFQQKSIVPFVVAGIVFVILLVIGLAVFVNVAVS